MGAKVNGGAYSNIHGNKPFGVNLTGITKRTVIYQEDQHKEARYSRQKIIILIINSLFILLKKSDQHKSWY